MASKKFIEERIAKAQENIKKKESLIVKMEGRIQKNIEKLQKLGLTSEQIEKIENPWGIDRSLPNWEKAFNIAYAIDNAKDSIESANEALPELREKLQNYQKELEHIIEKENSRDIKVILEFLEGWKEMVKRFYIRSLPKWIETLEKYYEEDSKYCDWYNHNRGFLADKETRKQMEKPRNVARARHAEWNFLDRYIERTPDGYKLDMALLQKDLDEEAKMKYDFIIERTNKIVGQITDASNLEIGEKGDLNGYIIGTRGTAKVNTIGAGGYNIQCYHFRTLIHEVK